MHLTKKNILLVVLLTSVLGTINVGWAAPMNFIVEINSKLNETGQFNFQFPNDVFRVAPFNDTSKTITNFTIDDSVDAYKLVVSDYITDTNKIPHGCQLDAITWKKPIHMIVYLFPDKSCRYTLTNL